MSTQLSPLAIGGFRDSLSGKVITPSDPSYDEARKIWNGDIDRRPAAIVRCASVEDIKRALAFARQNNLKVAVKSGGHSMPGHSCVDGAITIDLRELNKVTIDASAKKAVVQGGAIWSEVDGPAQAQGLAMTGGHVTHTGVAGLTLGGGIGHLMRKYGLVVDQLESAEIVTADGRVLRASAAENPDLFWAIRGGGGNFGIATEFVFRLSPLGTTVLAGLAWWAPDKGPELFKHYREFCKSCPDEVTTMVVYMHAPPFEFVPADVQLKPGYAFIVAGTDIAIAEKAVKGMRSFSSPLFDIIGPMPYLALQGMFDPALPPGTKTYAKGHFLTDLSDDAARTIHENALKMPPGRSQLFTMQLGGAVARVADDATAVGGRNFPFMSLILGTFDEAAERQPRVDWARSTWSKLAPFAKGEYVNLGDTQDEAALRATYGPEKYAKLQKIKAKYDPDNVFSLNQNIKPAE